MRNTLLAIFFLLTAASNNYAFACKCSDPGSYDIVFRGKVIYTMPESHFEKEKLGSSSTTFQVLDAIQGPKLGRVMIHSPSLTLCGVLYEEGKVYVVYAKSYGSSSGLFETKYCYGRVANPPASAK
jgi:hypothetical protein